MPVQINASLLRLVVPSVLSVTATPRNFARPSFTASLIRAPSDRVSGAAVSPGGVPGVVAGGVAGGGVTVPDGLDRLLASAAIKETNCGLLSACGVLALTMQCAPRHEGAVLAVP